jgi:ribulose-phosphate 3-epimerase
MNKKSLSISILNVEDIDNFLKNLVTVESMLKGNKMYNDFFENIIHFDVMDNKFVKNTGVDINKISIVKDMGFYVDTHLMVSNPIEDKYIDNAILLGTDEITIHYEIDDFEKVFDYLTQKKQECLKEKNKELKLGIAIKPDTDILEISKYLEVVDKVLVMTVEPGFGGQEYIDNMNSKIAQLSENIKKSNSNVCIQIDGGVNLDKCINPLRLNVDSYAIGSDITKCSEDVNILYNKILSYNIIKMFEELPKDSNIEFDKKLLQIVPGGYGQDDVLLGIRVPVIRGFSNKWYLDIPNKLLEYLIKSSYHEYRKFALFCISNTMKKNNNKNENEDRKVKETRFEIFENNLQYINNWDLTDESGPSILAYRLLELYECSNTIDKKIDDKINKKVANKLLEYINSENMWIKRIGIVSLLTLVRNDKKYIDITMYICDIVYYENHHLLQKATGWVLREIYKKEQDKIVDFLLKKSVTKKTPSILLSYACEKMSKEEKDKIREVNNQNSRG